MWAAGRGRVSPLSPRPAYCCSSVPLFWRSGDDLSGGDGMLDDWEITRGLSPSNAADATLDADNDGFINLHEEYWAGTDPNDPLFVVP